MSGSIRWKLIWVSALLVLFAFISAANFIPKAERVESAFWPDDGLRLGLDLRGGIHWVVGVQLDNAIKQELEFIRKSISEQLEEDGRALESSKVENLELTLVPDSSEDRAAVEEIANDTATLDRVDDPDGAPAAMARSRLTSALTRRTASSTSISVVNRPTPNRKLLSAC